MELRAPSVHVCLEPVMVRATACCSKEICSNCLALEILTGAVFISPTLTWVCSCMASLLQDSALLLSLPHFILQCLAVLLVMREGGQHNGVLSDSALMMTTSAQQAGRGGM